jgi:hypothetical protein
MKYFDQKTSRRKSLEGHRQRYDNIQKYLDENG